MHVSEVQSDVEGFSYKVWFSHRAEGWRVDGVSVLRLGAPVLPRRALSGIFVTQTEAIDRGVHWCEVIVKHLTTAEIPTAEDLSEQTIEVDQVEPKPDKNAA